MSPCPQVSFQSAAVADPLPMQATVVLPWWRPFPLAHPPCITVRSLSSGAMPSALSVSHLTRPAAARCSGQRRASQAPAARPAQPAAAVNLAFGSRARLAGRRRTAALAPVAAAGASGGGATPPVKLTLPDGSTLAMPQAAMVVGSSAEADLRVEGPGVAAQHACLEWRSGRLFCTALAADPDLLLAPTHCWLDGVELRPGVSAVPACRGGLLQRGSGPHGGPVA